MKWTVFSKCFRYSFEQGYVIGLLLLRSGKMGLILSCHTLSHNTHGSLSHFIEPNFEYPNPVQEDFKAERCATPSSSPPFLFGSPPCRTANPLVQDAHFGVERLTNMHRTPTDLALPRSPHAREQFGKKPATVRVVGFHC